MIECSMLLCILDEERDDGIPVMDLFGDSIRGFCSGDFDLAFSIVSESSVRRASMAAMHSR